MKHTRSSVRSARMPRRVLAVLGASAALPLVIAPLSPAFALETSPASGVTAEAAPDAASIEVADTATALATAPAPSSEAAPEPSQTEEPSTISPEVAGVAEPTQRSSEHVAPEITPAIGPAQGSAAPDSADPADPALGASGPDVTANLSSLPPSGWYRERQPIRFVAADNGNGVRSITVIVNDALAERAGGDTTLYIEGSGVHKVEYWATDRLGNSSAPKTLTLPIDGAAPRIATGAPQVIQQGEQVSLRLDCWDQHSGVQRCYAEGADDEILPSEELGEQSIALHAVDYAGNHTTEIFNYLVEAPSAQTPDLRFDIAPAPASGWYRGPVSINVVASTTDPDDEIAAVRWWSTGPSPSGGEAMGENEIAFTVNTDGITQVSYSATTVRGGVHQNEATIRIDGAAPEIRFSGPQPLTPGSPTTVELGSARELEFECSDAHSGISYCGEGRPVIASHETVSLDTASLGMKSVVIDATDVAGNHTSATFEYEVIAPKAGGSGTPSGQPSTQPPVERPATSNNKPDLALARTGASWAPVGAIGVAIAAAGGALALTRFRAKDR